MNHFLAIWQRLPLPASRACTPVRAAAAPALLALTLCAGPALALSSRALMTFTGSGQDEVGQSVSTVGDVNGDGYPDVIVGAPGANNLTGAVYVFFGGPGMHSTPDITLTGESQNSLFGSSVAAAGDLNGDGRADLIVGSDNYNSGQGRAYVFYGGPGLVSKGAGSADVILTGEAGSLGFGYPVATAGDVNGDGRADVIVGDYQYNSSQGRAYLFYGGPTLVSKGAGAADVILTGEGTGTRFGFSVAAAGDVNGDGRGDVLVGATNASSGGRAYIFYGGHNLVSKGAGSADVILTGEANSTFGTSVAAADINGDGLTDVVVGAAGYNSNAGRAYVFYGGPSLISQNATSAEVILTGEALGNAFGCSMSPAGDVNGDGRADLIVGAFGNSGNSGRAYIFLGGPGLSSKGAGAADLVLSGEGTSDYFSVSVSGAGDVNGDGFADVIVGAYGYRGGALSGRAYVFGIYPYQVISPNGGERWIGGQPATVRWLGHDPADVSLSLDGGLSWSNLLTGVGGQADNTASVVVPGQVSGDAVVRVSYSGQTVSHSTSDRSDAPFSLISPAGAPGLKLRRPLTGPTGNGGVFGSSVSALADVNGDGYPDLIVGAPSAVSTPGAVYIYYGGPSMHSTPDVTLTGEAATNQFGCSVSAAGDVNGDGRVDIIVGAYEYSTYAGRAYIFYGGPTLTSKGAAGADVILTGETINNDFGITVANAGDVNGDGRADVIVGAYGNSANTGRAYIFFGGPTLTSKGAGSADAILTGEATSNNFGRSVSTAGDVNGDGRADVVVGASGYGTNTGRAYIFYGGSTLVSKGAAGADVILTGETAGSGFGQSVSPAGDVNADGRADVIVGASGYNGGVGRAYVFYGGSNLVSKGAGLADVTLTGEGTNSYFGTSVSGAGDLNGDGRGDLIVGAFAYNSYTGRAYVFYGGPSLASKNAAGADVILTGEGTNNYFGFSVSAAGDVEQDGFPDVIVGAYGYGANTGRAYLYDTNRYQILSPNGGETWNVGGSQTISWQGAEPANLWLSVDGGTSYQLLDQSIGGNAVNTVTERVPHSPTRFARVKLTPLNPNVPGSARSDSLFTIQSSVGLLTFRQQELPEGGTLLTWSTNPAVGPEGIAGYRLYRIDAGSGPAGVRLGPDPITDTRYTDASASRALNYRLSAVNGLGEELELGEVSSGPLRSLSAWPIPYRGGDLHVSFSVAVQPGAPGGTADIGIYNTAGRLIKRLAQGVYAPGMQALVWDGLDAQGTSVPPGIYFLRAQSGGSIAHVKLAVLR